MKKKLLYILLLLSVVLIFVSCSKEKKSQDKNVTINFSTFYEEGSMADAYKDIINKFEESHKNIKVNLQAQSTGYDDAISDALQKGKGPDIIGLQRSKMIDYAKQGSIMNLSDWVNSQGLKDKYYGVNLGYGSFNGKYYGIGDLPYTVEWYYNENLFKKAGIVNEPETLDELINACTKLKKYTSTPIALGAKEPWAMNVLFGAITSQTIDSGELAKAYASGQKPAFESLKGGDEAAAILAKLYKSGALNSRITNYTYADSVNDFVKGKAAILPMGSWASEKIEKSKPKGFEYGVFETPVKFVSNPFSEVSATAVQVITVNEKSKYKEEALEFMSYLFSEEAQTIFAQKNGTSGMKSVNGTPADKIKRQVLNHLGMTNENSTMYIDNVTSKMNEVTGNRLLMMLQNKQKTQDIWNLIISESYAK